MDAETFDATSEHGRQEECLSNDGPGGGGGSSSSSSSSCSSSRSRSIGSRDGGWCSMCVNANMSLDV